MGASATPQHLQIINYKAIYIQSHYNLQTIGYKAIYIKSHYNLRTINDKAHLHREPPQSVDN